MSVRKIKEGETRQMNDRKEKNNSQGVTLSRKTLIAAIAVVLLLIAGGVAVGINWNHWFGEETPKMEEQKEAFQPDLDPDAENWTGEKIPDKSEEEAVGIKIPGYPSITIPADQQEVAVSLLNPEGNPCYFTFELVLKDTDETLYTSKLVAPGQAISNITLSKSLPAGEYPATLRITTASLEDGSAMNGANVETVLMVQ